MVLQNFMDFLKVEPELSDEICPVSSHDGDRVIGIKVEVSDTQDAEDPLLVSLPEIKAEHEVSCMPACPLLRTFPDIQNYVLSFPSPFISPHLLCWKDSFNGCLRNACN
jgi:hypothetical protein